MITSKLSVLAFATLIASPVAAHADDRKDGDRWYDGSLRSGYGISTTLGGGFSGFTGKTMRNTVSSDVGALWDLRVTLGSHTPVAIDVGYIGTAQAIDALTGSKSGTLIGTTIEGALRWNILPRGDWNPYVFAGVGWQRYDVSGANFRQSDTGMNDSDNEVVFPMGAGLSFRDHSGLVADVRGTFRASIESDLVLESMNSNNHASMHTWEASAAIGYEF